MQKYLADGDACFARSDYECAKNNYERYRDTSMSGKQDISRKLANSEKAYLARRAADSYYTAGNYASAKEKYNEVLSLHPEDSRSQEYSSISSARLQPVHNVGNPGHELYVTNQCSHPIDISIYFMNNATNQWEGHGIWNIKSGKSISLATGTDVKRLATTAHEIYYYGETTDGTNLVWKGDYPRTVGSKTLNMLKVADHEGAIDWALACPQ
jgi:tetratricopeptide (TPR) repeat protein